MNGFPMIIRQAEQKELSRPDLRRLAYSAYYDNIHQISMGFAKHWLVLGLSLAAFAATVLCGFSIIAALAVMCCVPAYFYLHSRLYFWLTIERQFDDYRDLTVWRLPHRIFVAECSTTKQLIGLVCMHHLSDAMCDMQHLGVAPSHRRKGIARRLVEHMASEAGKLGYSKMTLFCLDIRTPAMRMYQRMGFSRDRVHDEGAKTPFPFLHNPYLFVHWSCQLGPEGLLCSPKSD